MYVENDAIPGNFQRGHRVPEAVPRGGLGDVLHQLPAVGFLPDPLLVLAGPQVGQPQLFELRFRLQLRPVVDQPPPGGQGDEQIPGLALEVDAVVQSGRAALHGPNGRFLDLVPEAHNVLVGLAPPAHDAGELVLRDAAFQGPHLDQRPGAALVAAGQGGDFPL